MRFTLRIPSKAEVVVHVGQTGLVGWLSLGFTKVNLPDPDQTFYSIYLYMNALHFIVV